MEQLQAFHEDWRDAMHSAAIYCGGPKNFSAELFPQKKPQAAYDWWKDCMNPERQAKFDPEDFIRALKIARSHGFHGLMYLTCDETGYARPPTIEPEDAEAECVRQMDDCVDRMEDVMKRYEQIQTQKSVKR